MSNRLGILLAVLLGGAIGSNCWTYGDLDRRVDRNRKYTEASARVLLERTSTLSRENGGVRKGLRSVKSRLSAMERDGRTWDLRCLLESLVARTNPRVIPRIPSGYRWATAWESYPSECRLRWE